MATCASAARVRRARARRLRERSSPTEIGAEGRHRAELLFDAQEPVVLGHPLRARRRAGLDLSAAAGDRQVGDERIFGLARAVRDHRAEAGARAIAIVSRVSVSVPIWLSLIRIALAAFLAMPRSRNVSVGDEQIVADELHCARRACVVRAPAVPVVFGQAVFESRRSDIFRSSSSRTRSSPPRSSSTCRSSRSVGAVLPHLARRRIERDGHVLARLVAGLQISRRTARP